MSETVDLTDPDCEPTDEQLIELSKRAFAHVAAEQQRLREEQRARIAAMRADVLARFGKP